MLHSLAKGVASLCEEKLLQSMEPLMRRDKAVRRGYGILFGGGIMGDRAWDKKEDADDWAKERAEATGLPLGYYKVVPVTVTMVVEPIRKRRKK